MLSDDPAIAYAGCPQGLDPNETGPRGCRVVTLDDRGFSTEFVPTAAVVWERASVDCSAVDSIDGLRAAVLAVAEDAARDADERPAVMRVELVGRSDVHGALARPGVLDDLVADLRADGLERDPWVWIDRIADRTRPVVDLDALRAGQDFAGDLVRLADTLASDADALSGFLNDASGSVLGLLDSRDVPTFDAASVLERARDLALDRLLAEESR